MASERFRGWWQRIDRGGQVAVAAVLSLPRRIGALLWPARFFVGGLLVNLLLMLALVLWKLPGALHLLVRFDDALPAAQVVDENLHQSHEDGRQAWEKVADLRSLEPTPLDDAARRQTEPLSIPHRTESLLPTLPVEQARRLPPERVLFVPPEVRPAADAVEQTIETARLPRRRPAATAMREPSVTEVALPLPEAAPPEVEPPVARPEVVRDDPDLPVPEPPRTPDLSRRVPRVLPVDLAEPPTDDPADTLATIEPAMPAVHGPRRLPRNVAEVDEAVEPAAVLRADPDESDTVEQPSIDRRVALVPSPPRVEIKSVLQPKGHDDPVRPLPEQAVERDESAAENADRPSQDSEDAPASPLVRTIRRAEMERVAEPAEETVELAQADGAEELPFDGVDVALPPRDAQRPRFDVRTPDELTGPSMRLRGRIVVGSPADEPNDAPPAFSPRVSRLDRPRARAPRVALAQDNVGLRALFTLRQGDDRRQHIELFGGTDESEQAVDRGLEWLARHQNEDGSWSLHAFHENCDHPQCGGAGSERSNAAATALALLPFLGAGHTHREGHYREPVAAGLRWLIEHQDDEGRLLGPGDHQPMYSHGLAAIALCEVFGMTQDPELKEPARRCLEFIVAAQHAGSGGWRYTPNQPGDTSVVGWQVMALKSGEMAGLEVPRETLDRSARWLESVEGNKPVGGTFGYTHPHPTPAMTAEGLLCLQFLGLRRDDPRLRAGADYLLDHLPQPDQRDTSYYWYYATQVMYHMQGGRWEAWNERLRDQLVETQLKEGPQAGTWDPRDHWEQRAGRLYATSLKLLMLEVYYRHLPLYEQLGD